MMYLITMPGMEPFFTDWFMISNNYVEGKGMVVYNLRSHEYYDGGEKWKPIPSDHL